MEMGRAIRSVQHREDYKTALKYSGVRADAVQIRSEAPRDRLPCPPICSSHTSVSPHHLHLSITFPPLYTPLLSIPPLCSSPRPAFPSLHLRHVYFHTSPPLLISPPFFLCRFFSPAHLSPSVSFPLSPLLSPTLCEMEALTET